MLTVIGWIFAGAIVLPIAGFVSVFILAVLYALLKEWAKS